MEWLNILVAILFVIGITAYPGWNLILRLDLNHENQTKIPRKLSKPIKNTQKQSKQISELEKIFGV